MKTTLPSQLVALAIAIVIAATAVWALTAAPAIPAQVTTASTPPAITQVEVVGKRMSSDEKASFDAAARLVD